MVSKPKNPFHLSFLQVLRLVVLVFSNLIKWKLCFIGMNVVVGHKTTTKTPTTWGQSNMVVEPTFTSKGLTHGQMWWKSFFTIGLTLEPMEILLAMHVTWGPHFKCQHMLHVISQVEGVYIDLIRVRVHCETNSWQAQGNLVGTSEFRWMDDPWWFPTTPVITYLDWKHKGGS